MHRGDSNEVNFKAAIEANSSDIDVGTTRGLNQNLVYRPLKDSSMENISRLETKRALLPSLMPSSTLIRIAAGFAPCKEYKQAQSRRNSLSA